MAQAVDAPLDDGRIRLPRVDAANNKIAPTTVDPKDGKGPIALRTSKGRDLDRDAVILARAKKRFDRCVQAESDNRKNGLEDDKFYAGQQWPSDVQTQRSNDRRPCLTINKLPTLVHQVTNDVRQNRPAINVEPVGDRGDRELANALAGIIRHIERQSVADIAYDTAFESAARKGWGYWRILTEYESPDSFNQTLVIKRIRNMYTVYLDPDSQEPDGSDCRYGFVTEMLPRSEFEDKWPDADPLPWSQAGFGESMKNWVDSNQIRIAEYYEIENEKRTLVALANGFTGWKDELEENHAEILREREADCPQVTWYKLTAKEILEETEWLGKWIPIVKLIGDEIDIEGKVTLSGLIRNAKDAQRMYNYWVTAETEMVALAPKAKWLVAEGQIEGHENQWRQAHSSSYPYLEYKPEALGDKMVPPPSRQQPEPPSGAIIQAKQSAAQDMMATTGIRFDATMQERTYDESGRALRELRERGDMGSFHLVDNFARSLRHCGNMLVDLIQKLLDTRRTMTILREDLSSEDQIGIDPTMPQAMTEARNPKTGKMMKIFNPKIGKYAVTVTIGPSYATKRIEASESMMDFVRAVPSVAPAVVDLIAKNQDWPGAAEFATRLAKTLPPNLLTPEQKDVPPQVQALLGQMQQQIQGMGQERARMMQALTEQQSDRAQRQDKIDKDFEAKLMGIVQKAEATYQAHVGSQIKDLAEGVNLLRETLSEPADTKGMKMVEPK